MAAEKEMVARGKAWKMCGAAQQAKSEPALRRGASPAPVFHSAKDLEIQRSGALSPRSRSPTRGVPVGGPQVHCALESSRMSREEVMRALGEQLLLLDRIFIVPEDKVRARGLLVHCTRTVKAMLGSTLALENVARSTHATLETRTLEAQHTRAELEAALAALAKEQASRAADAEQAASTLAAAEAAAKQREDDLLKKLDTAWQALAQLEECKRREAERAERTHSEELARTKEVLEAKRREELEEHQRQKAESDRALEVRAHSTCIRLPA